MRVRWLISISCLVWLSGCSLLDRQGEPQIVGGYVNFVDRSGRDTSVAVESADIRVGRGREVRIVIQTDDPDNDELDFMWTSSKGEGDTGEETGLFTFGQTRRDTLVDLFQDSLTVSWKAPGKVETGEDDVYVLNLVVSDGESGEKAEYALLIIVWQHAPAADAGRDTVYDFSDNLFIELNGTGSTDPNGDGLSYEWRQIGGPGVNLNSESRYDSTPKFAAVAPADYLFALTVADDSLSAEAADTSQAVVRIRVTDRAGRGP